MSTNLRMEQSTRVNGKAQYVTVKEFKSGQMVLDMKGNGSIIRLMGKENSGMSMVMCLTVNGKMTKQTGTVFTLM